jgi:hypothetical protein
VRAAAACQSAHRAWAWAWAGGLSGCSGALGLPAAAARVPGPQVPASLDGANAARCGGGDEEDDDDPMMMIGDEPICSPLALLPASPVVLRVRVEIMGSPKFRIGGKSQSLLIMINPIIFTRTRIPIGCRHSST